MKWSRPTAATLHKSYISFSGLVSAYCHEIRFALDYGEDLNQINGLRSQVSSKSGMSMEIGGAIVGP